MNNVDKPLLQNKRGRLNFGIVLTLVGAGLFTLGAKPAWVGLDRSEAIGYVQIGVFSFGLVLLCMGAMLSLTSLWVGKRSIAADIGIRLAWTGLIVALFASLADLLGLSARQFPYHPPFFGYWQARGVLAGEVMIIIGLILLIPFKEDLGETDKHEIDEPI